MENWTQEIDRITDDFFRVFGTLSPEQMNWRPNPNTWSIAQNIEHLMVTNETYFPIIQQLRDGTYSLPFIAKFGFLVALTGNTILKSLEPTRKKKVKTFPIWEPHSEPVQGDILEQFKQHQKELKAYIENASDLIDRGAVISSPANRMFVYKLETAFDIIVTHEKRHFEQAKEVLELINR